MLSASIGLLSHPTAVANSVIALGLPAALLRCIHSISSKCAAAVEDALPQGSCTLGPCLNHTYHSSVYQALCKGADAQQQKQQQQQLGTAWQQLLGLWQQQQHCCDRQLWLPKHQQHQFQRYLPPCRTHQIPFHHRAGGGSGILLLDQGQQYITARAAGSRRWQQWPFTASTLQQQQARPYTTNSSSSSSSSSSPSSGNTRSPKNVKGAIPQQGPAAKTLTAVPYTATKSEAVAAFTQYHSGKWYQSRQQPALSKPFKETYMPFWVGTGYVTVEVRGAEIGHEHLVTRYDRVKGRPEQRWETVWNRIQLNMSWQRQLKPEEADAQIYASWKYFRQDVETLKPGTSVNLAREITPDMLKASPGTDLDTRRVGPFTMQPNLARRLIMAKIESAERRRAEEEIARVTGANHVRFVDLHCTWQGSTGAVGGAGAAASSSGGLDLMPVYVPAYVFSWWHGGSKVRTFVSGVNLSVGGVHVLDDKKVATVAAAAASGVGLFFGFPLPAVFWGGLVVPFVAGGVIARFWPLIRDRLLRTSNWINSTTDQFWHKEEQKDYCEVDWNASFVRAFAEHEQRHQRQEQRESSGQAHKPGGDTDPFENWQEFMQDPFRWFERQYAQSQQQQWQQQFNRQQQGKASGYQQRRQQQYQQGFGAGAASTSSNPRDPKGYYKTLGVEPGATTPDVQAAFRGLALQHHPDRFKEPDEKARATKRFQVITEAYQVLRDPKKRRQYDAGQYMG